MSRTPPPALTSSGYVLLPIGILMTSLASFVHGWAHGAVLGVGIVVLLVSAVVLGASIGERRAKGQGWLPSRDGDG